MTIDVPAETVAQLKAKAQAEGVSIGTYVERLLREEDLRRVRRDAFRQAIDARLADPSAGESVDGEEVMARLIAELDSPRNTSATA